MFQCHLKDGILYLIVRKNKKNNGKKYLCEINKYYKLINMLSFFDPA